MFVFVNVFCFRVWFGQPVFASCLLASWIFLPLLVARSNAKSNKKAKESFETLTEDWVYIPGQKLLIALPSVVQIKQFSTSCPLAANSVCPPDLPSVSQSASWPVSQSIDHLTNQWSRLPCQSDIHLRNPLNLPLFLLWTRRCSPWVHHVILAPSLP